MRAKEFLLEDAHDLQKLVDACESWIELWNIKPAIDTILSHPLSQECKSSTASIIYRSVFVDEGKFNKTGKINLKPQHGGMIPYSENINWGGAARDDFDYNGDILKFEKKFNSSDLVLNFSQLLAKLSQLGYKIHTAHEAELWMRAVPYYKTFTKEELIGIDRG